MRETLLEDNKEARSAFLSEFPTQIEAVTIACITAYRAIDRLNFASTSDNRRDHVRLFLHAGLNALVSSTNLLVAGFPLQAGGAMRQFNESMAMALLCRDPASHVLEEFTRLKTDYPIDQAVGRLCRKKQWERISRLIGAPHDGWDAFANLNELWSQFSHAGAFSLGFQFKFSRDGALILGAEWDEEKKEQYEKELNWRRSAFDSIGNLADALAEWLSAKTDKA